MRIALCLPVFHVGQQSAGASHATCKPINTGFPSFGVYYNQDARATQRTVTPQFNHPFHSQNHIICDWAWLLPEKQLLTRVRDGIFLPRLLWPYSSYHTALSPKASACMKSPLKARDHTMMMSASPFWALPVPISLTAWVGEGDRHGIELPTLRIGMVGMSLPMTWVCFVIAPICFLPSVWLPQKHHLSGASSPCTVLHARAMPPGFAGVLTLSQHWLLLLDLSDSRSDQVQVSPKERATLMPGCCQNFSSQAVFYHLRDRIRPGPRRCIFREAYAGLRGHFFFLFLPMVAQLTEHSRLSHPTDAQGKSTVSLL